MTDAPARLRQYVTEVQGRLKGEGPPTHLPQRPALWRVPVYVAALTSRVVEEAAELADGIMTLFWSTERVAASEVWNGGRQSCRLGQGRGRTCHLTVPAQPDWCTLGHARSWATSVGRRRL
jgi:alkanesulfonate monooxygenase SsuD/methylene tetrahydromethanopterin reductase-like flavin-dependent oxidoreductase (luciferase family)